VSPEQRRSRFRRDYRRLAPREQKRFRAAARLLDEGLKRGLVDPRLRFKRVQGHRDVWELSFDRDGRATLRYERLPGGELLIEWRRVGGHDIFAAP